MRLLLHTVLICVCIGHAGCGRSDSHDEAERQSEYAKMTAAIERSLDSSKKCALIARNSPYLQLVVMMTRDFTLMVEHRDSMMKDPLIGDYRFNVRWEKGEKLRKKLAIADYGLRVMKEEVGELRSHVEMAVHYARHEPDIRTVLFDELQEVQRLHDAIQYSEDVLSDPRQAVSSEIYDPRFVERFKRIADQLEELMAE